MPVPFLGRLNITEYVALVGSFLLVALEAIVRVLTLALPSPLIALFYRASRRLVNGLSSAARKRAEERRKSISTSIRDASDFVDMCALAGYTAEEHVVQTKDGYLLCLHRLAWRQGEEDKRVNCGPGSLKKRVVYLHHGLLMNSEVWVCLTDRERCLPFVLVERGFDVWLGNNRGNKYSKKCIHCTSTSPKFWNFSIDEFAFHDIPDSIAYILETTAQPSLSYIGFSQGTAQAFASLAVHPKLNTQVNVFIALAPAMSPQGLHNGIVDALVKASPSVLFLLFGRRSILSSATMWESILYPPIFIRLIDMGLSFLFNWKTKNIATSQKLAAYPHLYSFTSTKSVVHWFQIIRTKSFQMFDDDVHSPVSLSATHKYTKVARFPTRNIKTPIVLVYGGSDSLVDIGVMLRQLPPQTVSTEIPHYEHLDFLWARDVDAQVFPHVFDALDCFPDAEHTKEEFSRYRTVRSTSISASGTFRRHEKHDSSEEAELTTVEGGADGVGEPEEEEDDGAKPTGDGTIPAPARHNSASRARPRHRRNSAARNRHDSNPRQHQATEALRGYDVSPSGVMTHLEPVPDTVVPRAVVNGDHSHSHQQASSGNSYFAAAVDGPSESSTPAAAQTPARPGPRAAVLAQSATTNNTSPESPSSPSQSPSRAGRSSGPLRHRTASSMSYESLPRGAGNDGRGIRLGAGRATSGIITTTVAGADGGSGAASPGQQD